MDLFLKVFVLLLLLKPIAKNSVPNHREVAVTNAIRYSRANIFKVIFKEDGTNYHVVIRDNGIGFADWFK